MYLLTPPIGSHQDGILATAANNDSHFGPLLSVRGLVRGKMFFRTLFYNKTQVTRTQHTRQKQRRHTDTEQQTTKTLSHTQDTHSTTNDNGLVAVVRVVIVAHKIVVGGLTRDAFFMMEDAEGRSDDF